MPQLSSPTPPQNRNNLLSSNDIDWAPGWQGIMAKIAILKRERFSEHSKPIENEMKGENERIVILTLNAVKGKDLLSLRSE